MKIVTGLRYKYILCLELTDVCKPLRSLAPQIFRDSSGVRLRYGRIVVLICCEEPVRAEVNIFSLCVRPRTGELFSSIRDNAEVALGLSCAVKHEIITKNRFVKAPLILGQVLILDLIFKIVVALKD